MLSSRIRLYFSYTSLHGNRDQIGDSCRRGEVRRLVREQRRGSQDGAGRNWKFYRHGNLSQLHPGWAVRVAAENSADELLRVRLQVLREPDFERYAACAVCAGRDYFAHAGFLPAELHRGIVFEFGNYSESGLHDGAACRGGTRAADGASVQRIHPFEGDSGRIPRNYA